MMYCVILLITAKLMPCADIKKKAVRRTTFID